MYIYIEICISIYIYIPLPTDFSSSSESILWHLPAHLAHAAAPARDDGCPESYHGWGVWARYGGFFGRGAQSMGSPMFLHEILS